MKETGYNMNRYAFLLVCWMTLPAAALISIGAGLKINSVIFNQKTVDQDRLVIEDEDPIYQEIEELLSK